MLTPFENESAMGFCLRTAEANLVNLHWLRRAVGLSETNQFTSKQVPRLAWTLQCQQQWLADAVGQNKLADGIQEIQWHGHQIYSAGHLRKTWPQVCPKCIHVFGYCNRLWDLSPVTVCPIHCCPLIDRCLNCKAKLGWDRPGIAICCCKYSITKKNSEEPSLKSSKVVLAKLLATAVRGENLDRYVQELGLPKFFIGLSLGGVLGILDAFGRQEQEFKVQSASSLIRARPTDDWSEIVDRALIRLKEFEHCSEEWLNVGQLNQNLLYWILEKTSSPIDARAAQDLLERVQQHTPLNRKLRTNQLPLI